MYWTENDIMCFGMQSDFIINLKNYSRYVFIRQYFRMTIYSGKNKNELNLNTCNLKIRDVIIELNKLFLLFTGQAKKYVSMKAI